MENKKYFVFDSGKRLSPEEKRMVREDNERMAKELFESRRHNDVSVLSGEDNLRHVEGKVIVKIDIDSKDSHTFEDGTKIEIKRRFNNFDVKQTQPVNAIVISGEGMQVGSEILIHPNAIHDSGRIFDYKDSNVNIQYHSIPTKMCFAYYEDGWKPMPGFDFGLRIFKPYEGLIAAIEPKIIKDTLYVTTGELQGKVVQTLVACDYQIIFQDKDGREGNLIRFRPFGCPIEKREEEAVAILNDLTEQVQNKKLLVGINISDAKTI